MDWSLIDNKLEAFKNALESGDAAAAYLCCAQLLSGLLEACYTADGMEIPPAEHLYDRLPETRLGTKFRPNFDAYIRICIRLDVIYDGRKAEEFPQYTDGQHLLARLREFAGEPA